MSEELEGRIVTFVRRARSATANEIARSLGVARSDVNSVLYKGVGRHFRRSGDQQPKWSPLDFDNSPRQIRPERAVPIISHHDFHIDFAGGDWLLRIVVDHASRNDPVARVEVLGERHRLITVATYACGEMEGNTIPPAAIAIASSVLAWEIHESLRLRGVEAFNFELAVRDIYLSLTWQAAEILRGMNGTGSSNSASEGALEDR